MVVVLVLLLWGGSLAIEMVLCKHSRVLPHRYLDLWGNTASWENGSVGRGRLFWVAYVPHHPSPPITVLPVVLSKEAGA